MGLHHTKSDQSSSTYIQHQRLEYSRTITPIRTRNHKCYYSAWEEIVRCSHDQWLQGISEKFGFAPHAFQCNAELHNICAPGFCSSSLSHKLPGFSRCTTKNSRSMASKKLREHFEYNHIPAMISSLQNYSVHAIVNGSNSDTIMLSIYSISLEKTKFIIVDLKLNRYICALENDYYGLIEASKVHAAWSTDRTQVILRIPMPNQRAALDFYKGKKITRGIDMNNQLKRVCLVIKKDAKIYRRIYPFDPHVQFQFNPNYWSSRLVLHTSQNSSNECSVIHYNTTSLTPGGSKKVRLSTIPLSESFKESTLIVKNLHSWSTYQTVLVPVDADFRLLSLLYTSDSTYLILTFADYRCHCGPTLPISYFDVYHSNTLQRLFRLHTQLIAHICPWHMCRNYLTPIVSISSSRLAFCTSKYNNGKELQVSIVALPNEINLKSICRRIIRDYLHQEHCTIDGIANQLPYRLTQYLQYRPEYQ